MREFLEKKYNAVNMESDTEVIKLVIKALLEVRLITFLLLYFVLLVISIVPQSLILLHRFSKQVQKTWRWPL